MSFDFSQLCGRRYNGPVDLFDLAVARTRPARLGSLYRPDRSSDRGGLLRLPERRLAPGAWAGANRPDRSQRCRRTATAPARRSAAPARSPAAGVMPGAIASGAGDSFLLTIAILDQMQNALTIDDRR